MCQKLDHSFNLKIMLHTIVSCLYSSSYLNKLLLFLEQCCVTNDWFLTSKINKYQSQEFIFFLMYTCISQEVFFLIENHSNVESIQKLIAFYLRICFYFFFFFYSYVYKVLINYDYKIMVIILQKWVKCIMGFYH